MSQNAKPKETKCIAVKLPVELVLKLEAYSLKSGKSKNAVLIEIIKAGLNSS